MESYKILNENQRRQTKEEVKKEIKTTMNRKELQNQPRETRKMTLKNGQRF